MRGVAVVCALAFFILVALTVNHSFRTLPHTDTEIPMSTSTLSLTVAGFADGGMIPSQYTCDGEQTSPEVKISGVPAGTKSLAFIMDDPDVPKQIKPDGLFVHWVLFDLPATTTEIPQGNSVGVVGANGSGKNAYTGPCPPREYEPSTHRYFFKLYALDTMLGLPDGITKGQVEIAMEGHIVGQAQYVGKYKRQ